MILRGIKYFRFTEKLSTPFQSARFTISERSGYYLILNDEAGHYGIGEISPLSGLSKETADEVEAELKRIEPALLGAHFDTATPVVQTLSNLPSVQFGFEQALLCLIIKNKKDFLKDSFGIPERKEIKINTVVGIKTSFNQIEELIGKGFDSIKIKVGSPDFDAELNLIRKIRSRFANLSIRLDANGAWDSTTAMERINKLAEFDIEFIEDPCDNFEYSIKLSIVSPIPIAIDEPLAEAESFNTILNYGQVGFAIIKPMISGKLFSLFGIIDELERRGIKPVISSAFETAVGRAMLTLLASKIKHSHAHGLDTGRYFSAALPDPFAPVDGKIFFNRNNFPPDFGAIIKC